MKKTVKRPDGTEETVEGTAEEIAAYERKLQESPDVTSKSKSKRRILNEEDVRRIAKEEVQKAETSRIAKELDRITHPPVTIPWTAPDTTTKPWWNPPEIIYTRNDQPCLIEEFFRNNPNAGVCGIACSCPKCAIMCSVTNVNVPTPYEATQLVDTANTSTPMGGFKMPLKPRIPFISAFTVLN